MKEQLPNVYKKKVWVIVAILTMLAFFSMWSLRNGDTPAVMNRPAVPAPPAATK